MILSTNMSTPQPSKFVDLGNVRPGPFKKVYEEIEKEGIDPFDREEFCNRHPHPILFENENWFVSYNAVPYKGAGLHLLFVHKKFITSIEQISPEGLSDLWELIALAKKEFGFESGAFMMRFGDTAQTGASVTHLHAHIIVAEKIEGERKVILPRIFTPE